MMLVAVSYGIFLAARAEEIGHGIGPVLEGSTIGGSIDNGIGVQTVPEPSSQVLFAVGAVVAGSWARRSGRR